MYLVSYSYKKKYFTIQEIKQSFRLGKQLYSLSSLLTLSIIKIIANKINKNSHKNNYKHMFCKTAKSCKATQRLEKSSFI